MKNILIIILWILILPAMLALFVNTLFAADQYSIPIQTIAYESSGESLHGQEMVAGVIKQRMLERGLSADQVCMKRGHFSCWEAGRPTQRRQLKHSELLKAKKAWEQGEAIGYNHYCKYTSKPYWTTSAKRSLRVGKHIFYEL